MLTYADAHQVRLGTSATELMLERSFALNFSFFDGSNGKSMRHLMLTYADVCGRMLTYADGC